jgi:hypothetical protein
MYLPIKRFPKDGQLIESTFAIIKKVLEGVKKQNPINEYGLEMRDVIIWSLNLFNEFLTVVDIKQDDELKRTEYTVDSLLI